MQELLLPAALFLGSVYFASQALFHWGERRAEQQERSDAFGRMPEDGTPGFFPGFEVRLTDGVVWHNYGTDDACMFRLAPPADEL